MNCLRFGHSHKNCRSLSTCNHCGKNDHSAYNLCPRTHEPLNCINCRQNHESMSDHCPLSKAEREIHREAAKCNISFNDARQQLNHQYDSSLSSSLPRSPPPLNNQEYPKIKRSKQAASAWNLQPNQTSMQINRPKSAKTQENANASATK